ncbi:hypothetical protein ACLOJK_028511 [Asimina triloba]
MELLQHFQIVSRKDVRVFQLLEVAGCDLIPALRATSQAFCGTRTPACSAKKDSYPGESNAKPKLREGIAALLRRQQIHPAAHFKVVLVNFLNNLIIVWEEPSLNPENKQIQFDITKENEMGSFRHQILEATKVKSHPWYLKSPRSATRGNKRKAVSKILEKTCLSIIRGRYSRIEKYEKKPSQNAPSCAHADSRLRLIVTTTQVKAIMLTSQRTIIVPEELSPPRLAAAVK